MFDRINHILPNFLLKPKYRFYRHLLVQSIVLLITINVFWDEPDTILPNRFTVWIIYFILIDAIIYINMYLLVPRLLLKGRSVFYILSFPLLMLMVAMVIGLLNDTSLSEANEHTSSILEIGSSVASFSFFISGLTALLLLKNRFENIERLNELKAATMTVELENLQNQINPHFLFNMLNNANIMAGEDSEKSAYILTKLNDLLRYQIDDSAKERVLLKDDIAFLNDYLELEKTRRDRFDYTINQEGNCDIQMPPLLFIPFVENAVKHNPENNSYVRVTFHVKKNVLYFECENPKSEYPVKKKDGGIGLANIKKRLDLLFGANYKLVLNDEKTKYSVKLEFKI